MSRYIALIRAVNVGGSCVVKMDELRTTFESWGFTNVLTYIQSGNVIFDSDQSQLEPLTAYLENNLEKLFRIPVRIFLLTRTELEEAARNNPFAPQQNQKEHRFHLMFLSEKPDKKRVDALMAMQAPEYRFFVKDRVLYYTYPKAYDGRRRTIDFEKVLGVKGTSRTWLVVGKLIQLAGE